MSIEDRIERLERRCRRMTTLLVAITSAAALVVLAGAAAREDRIETQELTIVDQDGNARIRLGYHENGYGIRILDAMEELHAGMFDADGGAGVRIVKGEGDIRLIAIPSGGFGLSLRESGRRPQALLGITDGEATLKLADKDGKVLFHAPPED